MFDRLNYYEVNEKIEFGISACFGRKAGIRLIVKLFMLHFVNLLCEFTVSQRHQPRMCCTGTYYHFKKSCFFNLNTPKLSLRVATSNNKIYFMKCRVNTYLK